MEQYSLSKIAYVKNKLKMSTTMITKVLKGIAE